MKRWETFDDGTRRAPRYYVKHVLEYRVKSEREWSQVVSENFSRSGILFSRLRSLPLKTPVVIRIPIPLQDGRIVCNAQVMREDTLNGTTAVAISKYWFERKHAARPHVQQ